MVQIDKLIILIVDDNIDFVKRIVNMIEDLDNIGYINVAADYDEAVKRLEERPDLVLLDINLPDIDGYEIARQLRSCGSKHLLYVPVIAITANALKGDAEKALEAGCDVYMPKPINIRELWARVEALLEVTRH